MLPCGPALPADFKPPVHPWVAYCDREKSNKPPAVLRRDKHALVPLDADKHAAALFEAFKGDDETWFYLARGPYATPDAFDSVVRQYAKAWEQPGEYLWFCVLDASQQPVGFLALMRIDAAMGTVEIGSVTFSKALRGTAQSTATHAALLQWCFDQLGFRRVEWKCDSFNARSQAAALRLGFTYEGLFRNATHYKGRSRDTMWLGMTDVDYRKRVKPAHELWLASLNEESLQQTRTLQACFAQVRGDQQQHISKRLKPNGDVDIAYALANDGQVDDVVALYQTTWWGVGRTKAQVLKMLQTSPHVALVRHSSVIGFARALSDGVFKATIVDVIVREQDRSQGLGTRLVRAIMEHPDVAPVQLLDLNCTDALQEWYADFGFALSLKMRRMAMRRPSTA